MKQSECYVKLEFANPVWSKTYRSAMIEVRRPETSKVYDNRTDRPVIQVSARNGRAICGLCCTGYAGTMSK